MAAVRAIRPRCYWDGAVAHPSPVLGIAADGTLADPAGLPVEDVDGVVLPGLVNAHTHLEVAAVPRPETRGFLPWLGGLKTAGGAYTGSDAERFLQPAVERARAMRAAGTAVVGDISNTGLTAKLIRDAGMTGVCFHERIGIDVPSHAVLPDTIPAPHAVYSTHPGWIIACRERYATAQSAPRPNETPAPWSIHVDEDPFEEEFLRGEGPWPGMLRAFGRNLDDFPYPHVSPIAYLDQLTQLTGALLVHCVQTRPADLDRIAARGAAICLCVRSNLWIGGRVPDVQGMVDRGIRLVVGTDSLASSPDLDILAELAALRNAFPALDARVVLGMGTAAGRAVYGVSAPAEHLLVEGPRDLEQLLDGTVWPRRWLAEAAGEGARTA